MAEVEPLAGGQEGEGEQVQGQAVEGEPVSVKKEPFCPDCHNIKFFEGGVWKCKNTMCPLYVA